MSDSNATEPLRIEINKEVLAKLANKPQILPRIEPEIASMMALTVKDVLMAVEEVAGKEALTETVICTAITAASYKEWRSIMGPKHKQNEPERKRVVI